MLEAISSTLKTNINNEIEELKSNYETEINSLQHKLRKSIKKERIEFKIDEFEHAN